MAIVNCKIKALPKSIVSNVSNIKYEQLATRQFNVYYICYVSKGGVKYFIRRDKDINKVVKSIKETINFCVYENLIQIEW